MAEQSGFFDAHLVDGEYDRVYLAEHFAKYFASFIGNGIFGGKSNELMVRENETASMGVRVLSGQAWIDGYWYENDDEHPLTIDIADGVLHRIDSIVVRWNHSQRIIRLAVKKGVAATTPVAPVVQRDNDFYELKLADIYIKAGTTKITQSSITDKRYNTDVCGLVIGVVQQLDPDEFGIQLDTYITEFMAEHEEWKAMTREEFEIWVDTFQTSYTNWFIQFRTNSENSVSNLLTDSQQRVDNLIAAGNKSINDTVAAGEAKLNKTASDGAANIQNVVTTGQQNIAKVVNDGTTNINKLISDKTTEVNQVISTSQAKFDKLDTDSKNWFNGLKTQTEQDVSTMLTKGQSDIDAIKQAGETNLQKVASDGQKNIDNVVSTGTTNINKVVSDGTKAINDLVAKKETEIDNVISDGQQRFNDVIDELEEIAESNNVASLVVDVSNLKKLYIESAEHNGCFYQNRNGVIEWVNPPMIPGVEYQTIERWNGTPVYQRVIYTAALPNKTVMSIHVPAYFDEIISISGFAIDSDNNLHYQFPIILNGLTPAAVISFAEGDGGDGSDITINTNDDLSAFKGYMIVKYTKIK